MIKFSGYVSAAVLAAAVVVSAQGPAAQLPPTERPATRMPPGDQPSVVTVEGCLMRETDVQGRTPSVAERAGIAEDYFLTPTRMIKGSAPRTVTAEAKPGDLPIPSSGAKGARLMYKVEGLKGDELKAHLGHTVQIDGAFANLGSAQLIPEGSTDDLVEINGTALRHVSGSCATK